MLRNRQGEKYNIMMRGNPYVNLCLAVLGQAKRDRTRMWRRFKRENHWRKHYCIPLQVAEWIGNFMEAENGSNNQTHGKGRTGVCLYSVIS